ncbi:MAG TPA: ribbon-helix-helix domain-containing protein [Solirubrobacteraceae bacterium]|nr:ribbon-helix-helix domain-containing protein [Solirubrobacteraceae bacterium]
MAQVVARLDDDLVAELDALVRSGAVGNRSEAVRIGLERLIDEHRRSRIGAEIVDAYTRMPQTDEELAGIDEATRALIEEEPW